MSDTATEWTIESITEALGSPAIRKQFLAELNRARIYEVAGVFAKWQGIAEQLQHAVERAREIHTAELAGEEPPGEWITLTVDDLRARAAKLQQKNAA